MHPVTLFLRRVLSVFYRHYMHVLVSINSTTTTTTTTLSLNVVCLLYVSVEGEIERGAYFSILCRFLIQLGSDM